MSLAPRGLEIRIYLERQSRTFSSLLGPIKRAPPRVPWSDDAWRAKTCLSSRSFPQSEALEPEAHPVWPASPNNNR